MFYRILPGDLNKFSNDSIVLFLKVLKSNQIHKSVGNRLQEGLRGDASLQKQRGTPHPVPRVSASFQESSTHKAEAGELASRRHEPSSKTEQ